MYSFTCVCERKYNGKTIQMLSYRSKQHVALTLIDVGLALRSAGQGGVVLLLPSEEQVVFARQLADSRSNSAIIRHHRSSHDCLIAVCFHVFDLFSVVERARNHFHLDRLEAEYIKVHNRVLSQQKICESVVFGVNITPLSHVLHISNVRAFCYSYCVFRSVFLTACIGILLRRNLP